MDRQLPAARQSLVNRNRLEPLAGEGYQPPRGPNHGHQITANWAIESWSYEELRSLHDDLHEREIGATGTGMGTVQASYSYYSGSYSSSASQQDHRASQFSAGRKMFGR